jgi:hypothetical protein
MTERGEPYMAKVTWKGWRVIDDIAAGDLLGDPRWESGGASSRAVNLRAANHGRSLGLVMKFFAVHPSVSIAPSTFASVSGIISAPSSLIFFFVAMRVDVT